MAETDQKSIDILKNTLPDQQNESSNASLLHSNNEHSPHIHGIQKESFSVCQSNNHKLHYADSTPTLALNEQTSSNKNETKDESPSVAAVEDKKRDEALKSAPSSRLDEIIFSSPVDIDATLDMVDDIISVLSSMNRLRGGKPPTPVEHKLISEGYARVSRLIAMTKPKSLVCAKAVRKTMEDYGYRPRPLKKTKIQEEKVEKENEPIVPSVNDDFSILVKESFSTQSQLTGINTQSQNQSQQIQPQQLHQLQQLPHFQVPVHGQSQPPIQPSAIHNQKLSEKSQYKSAQVSESQAQLSAQRCMEASKMMNALHFHHVSHRKVADKAALQQTLQNLMRSLQIPSIVQKGVPGNSMLMPHQLEYPLTCEICRTTETGSVQWLVCDGCEKGFHVECLKLPWKNSQPPLVDWYCSQCNMDGKSRTSKYGPVKLKNPNLAIHNPPTAASPANDLNKPAAVPTVPKPTVSEPTMPSRTALPVDTLPKPCAMLTEPSAPRLTVSTVSKPIVPEPTVHSPVNLPAPSVHPVPLFSTSATGMTGSDPTKPVSTVDGRQTIKSTPLPRIQQGIDKKIMDEKKHMDEGERTEEGRDEVKGVEMEEGKPIITSMVEMKKKKEEEENDKVGGEEIKHDMRNENVSNDANDDKKDVGKQEYTNHHEKHISQIYNEEGEEEQEDEEEEEEEEEEGEEEEAEDEGVKEEQEIEEEEGNEGRKEEMKENMLVKQNVYVPKSMAVPLLGMEMKADVEWIGLPVKRENEKTYYSSFLFNSVIYKANDHALFRHESLGSPPYVARLQSLWEDTSSHLKWCRVNWCFFPNEVIPNTNPPLTPVKGEVYESNHSDNNFIEAIEGPCLVLPPVAYREEIKKRKMLEEKGRAPTDHPPLYLGRFFYDAPRGFFKAISG